MSNVYRLAVVGYESSVQIYKAAGADTYAVSNSNEAQEIVNKLTKQTAEEENDKRYAVLFVEENFYDELPADLIEKIAKRAIPALVPVPSPKQTNKKSSKDRLSKIVERAIGSDILA